MSMFKNLLSQGKKASLDDFIGNEIDRTGLSATHLAEQVADVDSFYRQSYASGKEAAAKTKGMYGEAALAVLNQYVLAHNAAQRTVAAGFSGVLPAARVAGEENALREMAGAVITLREQAFYSGMAEQFERMGRLDLAQIAYASSARAGRSYQAALANAHSSR